VVARDRRRLLPQRGSVPLAVHGLLEYGVGILLIFSSSLFGFDGEPRVAAILLGAAVIVLAAVSDLPTALMRRVPIDSHVVIDYVIGVVLIASPFIFGFSDDEGALAFFVVVGIGYLILTAITRFKS
jgi:uncharacterized membrane protein YhfC